MESKDLTTLVAQLIARHDQTLLVQQQTTELLRAHLKQRYEAQEERAFYERGRRVHPARFLTKQTPADDIDAFLLIFERTAEREEWPTDQWVGLIAPFLSGIAQTTYQDLVADPLTTYNALKREILKPYGFTLITRAQRYHDWVFDPTATP